MKCYAFVYYKIIIFEYVKVWRYNMKICEKVQAVWILLQGTI